MYAEFVGGRYHGKEMSISEVEEIGNGSYTEDLTELRELGGCCRRQELDNLPLVDGYLAKEVVYKSEFSEQLDLMEIGSEFWLTSNEATRLEIY